MPNPLYSTDPHRRYTWDVVRAACRRIARDEAHDGREPGDLEFEARAALLPMSREGDPSGPWTLAEVAEGVSCLGHPLQWKLLPTCDAILDLGERHA